MDPGSDQSEQSATEQPSARAEGGADLAPPPEPERDLFGRTPKHRADWSHRKAEPRTFALMWLVYLMVASALMFASLTTARIVTPSLARPAARTMLMVIAAGIVLLWPMVRLSQVAPARHTARQVLVDLLVMLIPVQVLLWPHAVPFIATWPVQVVVATSSVFVVWGVLIGAVLVIALLHIRAGESRPDLPAAVVCGTRRTVWMLVVAMMSLAVPVWLVIAGAADLGSAALTSADPLPGRMASPLTGLWDILSDRSASGRAARVSAEHWKWIGWEAVAALGAWMVACWASLARDRRSA